MGNPYVRTYEEYLSAWSAIEDQERLRLLEASSTSDVVFRNSIQTRNGIAEIAAHLEQFQQTTPGGSFRLLSMLAWGENALANWQLVKPDGTSGFGGYDALMFDGDGRISTIVMFVDVDQQRIA